jgi:hypothetical protein
VVTTPEPAVGQSVVKQNPSLTITWEKLPDDVPLEEEPVENTGQPLIAGALRESLELADYIQPNMLIASNLALCATVDGNLILKAPDWLYVVSVLPHEGDRRSYTPHLEGEVPRVVMEFLSETEGTEYSAKPTFPPGKWFFYEQVLQVPTYVIFEPATGLLEVYRLQSGRYQLAAADATGRYWLADMQLFLGVWQGKKEERTGYWLRWWDATAQLLPWGVEQVEQERQRAEQERQRAEQERQRADRLADYLRAQGINLEEIP